MVSGGFMAESLEPYMPLVHLAQEDDAAGRLDFLFSVRCASRLHCPTYLAIRALEVVELRLLHFHTQEADESNRRKSA